MSRRPILAGNWKMNLLRHDAAAFCATLGQELDAAPDASAGVDVVLFPASPLLDTVVAGVAASRVAVGGQDLHPADSGAHTGDTSGRQLADAGCRWVLCGHSERRQDHLESDQTVASKVEAAFRCGLLPMVCLGETAEERQASATEEVLDRQLAAVLPLLENHSGKGFTLAYEPVWAIGTGLTATPQLAGEAHQFLRQRLAAALGAERADAVAILYGGSAKPANVGELFAVPDIDGFLVGGASLDPASFLAMIRTTSQSFTLGENP